MHTGAGKSTLLNYILNDKSHGYKIAVINNEYASSQEFPHNLLSSPSSLSTPPHPPRSPPLTTRKGVKTAYNSTSTQTASVGGGNPLAGSSQLLKTNIFETRSGCLCCGRGANDLRNILHELIQIREAHHASLPSPSPASSPSSSSDFTQEKPKHEHEHGHEHEDGSACATGSPPSASAAPFDYVVIETTGLADPSFGQIFYMDPALHAHFYIDGIVTVLDSKYALDNIKRPEVSREGRRIINEAVEQVAVADRILLNKIDLVPSGTLIDIERHLRGLNPTATVMRTEFSRCGSLAELLNIRSFREQRLPFRPSGVVNHDTTLGTYVREGGAL